MNKTILSIPGVLLLVALGACSAHRKVSELARSISPNQKLVAILVETLVGGRAAPGHEDLYVGDQGIPVKLDDAVFTATICDGLKFSWVNDYTIEIYYPRSCAISHFTNRWFRPSDVQVGRPNPIEIILVRE